MSKIEDPSDPLVEPVNRRRRNRITPEITAPEEKPAASEAESAPGDPAQEPHFKPKQIAQQWGISESKATHIFENEPGVIKLGNRNGRRRTRISLRIPISVMKRVHQKLSA